MPSLAQQISQSVEKFLAINDIEALVTSLTAINKKNVFTLSEDDLISLKSIDFTNILDKHKSVIQEIYRNMHSNIWLSHQINTIDLWSDQPKQPIVVLEAHSDLASPKLLTKMGEELRINGYGNLLVEQPLDINLEQYYTPSASSTELEIYSNKSTIEMYKLLCKMTTKEVVQKITQHAAQIANTSFEFPNDYAQFQSAIAEDITKEYIDEQFLPTMKSIDYHVINVDVRSRSELDHFLVPYTLELSNLGFALAMYLYGARNVGSILMVGSGHGPGIQELYETLFPHAPQPLMVHAISVSVGDDSLLMHREQNITFNTSFVEHSKKYGANYVEVDMGTEASMQRGIRTLRAKLGLAAAETSLTIPQSSTENIFRINSELSIKAHDSLHYLIGDLAHANINSVAAHPILEVSHQTLTNSIIIPLLFRTIAQTKILAEIGSDTARRECGAENLTQFKIQVRFDFGKNSINVKFAPSIFGIECNIFTDQERKKDIMQSLTWRYQHAMRENDSNTTKMIENVINNSRTPYGVSLLTDNEDEDEDVVVAADVPYARTEKKKVAKLNKKS